MTKRTDNAAGPKTAFPGTDLRERIGVAGPLCLVFLVLLCAFFANSFWGFAAVIFIILLALCSCLMNLHVRKHLRCEFTLPATVPKNETRSGIFTVHNSSIFPCRKAIFTIRIENALTGESALRKIPLTLPSKGSASAEFDLASSHCGRILFENESARLFDWLGFLPVRAADISPVINAASSVTILPELYPCSAEVLPFRARENTSDTYAATKGSADPSELFSLRPYEKGDPVKSVHWKLSAKRESLIIKEISDPADETLLLYFDKKKSPAQDALAECVASIAESLCSRGTAFTLAWADDDGLFAQQTTSSDELLSILPMMIKNGDGILTPELPAFLQRFSKVLWFGQTYPFSVENVLPPDTVCLLAAEEDLPIGENLVIRFAPEEAEEVLSGMVI